MTVASRSSATSETLAVATASMPATVAEEASTAGGMRATTARTQGTSAVARSTATTEPTQAQERTGTSGNANKSNGMVHRDETTSLRITGTAGPKTPTTGTPTRAWRPAPLENK
jgi:hypothetical protein